MNVEKTKMPEQTPSQADMEIMYEAINSLVVNTGLSSKITPEMVSQLDPEACERVYDQLCISDEKVQYLRSRGIKK